MSTTSEPKHCAWCDSIALGWARVEPGYGVGNPSCGKHGAQFEPDPSLFLWSEMMNDLARSRAAYRAALPGTDKENN